MMARPHEMRPRKIRSTLMAVLAIALAGGLAWLRWHGMPSLAWQAFSEADEYELISLNPYPLRPDTLSPTVPVAGQQFHGHVILGFTTIADISLRDQLNRALQSGVRVSDGTHFQCFNPRHGIRVKRAGVTTEFVICFECRQVEVWRDGRKIEVFLTSALPQTTLDQVLERGGVALAPKEP